MITIYEWKSSSCDVLSNNATEEEYDIAFVGPGIIDDRTNWASNYINRVSRQTQVVRFDYTSASLEVGSVCINVAQTLHLDIRQCSRILVDATSLAFPEILYLFTVLDSMKMSFDVLYVQPSDYSDKRLGKSIDDSAMSLSEDGMLGPKLLPRYMLPSRKAYMLVMLGFEGHRLGGLFESELFNISSYGGLLGVPGFKAGWENIAIKNNMTQIESIGLKDVIISGANDPIYTYELLNNKYKALSYERRALFVAPLGTKPTSISVANFAVNNPSNLSLVYDFVKKKIGRSTGLDTAHLWKFRQH